LRLRAASPPPAAAGKIWLEARARRLARNLSTTGRGRPAARPPAPAQPEKKDLLPLSPRQAYNIQLSQLITIFQILGKENFSQKLLGFHFVALRLDKVVVES
jgi:hypothetical protein